MTDEPGPIKVMVAGLDYRADDQMRKFWFGTGGWISAARRQLGDDVAFSVILSRVSRDLRKAVGIEAAKRVFIDVAETMDEAAKGDINDRS
jgi:hypothetical protein